MRCIIAGYAGQDAHLRKDCKGMVEKGELFRVYGPLVKQLTLIPI